MDRKVSDNEGKTKGKSKVKINMERKKIESRKKASVIATLRTHKELPHTGM